MSKPHYDSKEEEEDEEQEETGINGIKANACKLVRFAGRDKASVLATFASLVNPFARRMTRQHASQLLRASQDVIADHLFVLNKLNDSKSFYAIVSWCVNLLLQMSSVVSHLLASAKTSRIMSTRCLIQVSSISTFITRKPHCSLTAIVLLSAQVFCVTKPLRFFALCRSITNAASLVPQYFKTLLFSWADKSEILVSERQPSLVALSRSIILPRPFGLLTCLWFRNQYQSMLRSFFKTSSGLRAGIQSLMAIWS
jgi:hypothetical protein